MDRWRNKGLWVAVAAWLLIVLQVAGVPVAPEAYKELVNGLLGILSLAGILSNPKDGEWYSDSSGGDN
jgi:uncharacterized membrane protein